jgi:N-acetyl-anhydromuramyl-L-alanine amidase AmpD
MKFDTNGWLDGAIEIDYLNKSMDRQGHKITHLVIHGTAGGSSAQGIANYFATSDVDASAHIEVDQAGIIAQGIPLSLAAWANGVITPGHASYIREDVNPNLYTASIEFVKSSTDNSNALTPIQQKVGFELIKCICDTYNIPKRAGDAKGGVIKHADIDPVNRARCPGNFDFPALWTYLQGGNKPMPTQPTTNQDTEARLCWASFFTAIGQTPPPTGSGIFQAWLSDWVNSGKQYGPPITHEYDSNDWSGNHIVAQEFAHARCEWNGAAMWYGPNGKIQ